MKRSLISFFLIFTFLYSMVLPTGKGITKEPDYKNSLSSFGLDFSKEAGLNTRDYEYGYLPTSQWTKMMINLSNGNQLIQADLINLPGTPITMQFSITYNSSNALTDIGIGKGWISNLHARIYEEPESNDIIYLDGSGFLREFVWSEELQKYLNPFGFSGSLEKLQTGFYKIVPLNDNPIVFDNNGKLIEIQDRFGPGRLIITHNDDGQPIFVTDFLSGRSLTLTWDISGYLTSIKDMMNYEWKFIRNSEHFLTELIKPENIDIKALFGYDISSGRMLSFTDFENQTYLSEYYTSGANTGFLKTWTQPANEQVKTSFSYESATGYLRKTSVTDGNEHMFHYFFGTNSHALEKIVLGSDGPTQLLHYNSAGFVDSFMDALGLETIFAYDEIYHLISITFPPPVQNGISPVHEYIYDQANLHGKLTFYKEKVTNTNPPTWAITQYFYTNESLPYKPTIAINPMNSVLTMVYDSNGLLTSYTEPTEERGNPPISTKTTSFEYDSIKKNLLRKTDTEGNDITYQYNLNGYLIAETQYEGMYLDGKLLRQREYTYNPLNQIVTSMNTITNQSATMTWNKNGALTSQVSEQGCEQNIVPVYQNPVILPGDPKHPSNLEKKSDNLADRLLPLSLSSYKPNYSSSTDTLGHTSTYQYRNDGSLYKATDYLSRTIELTQDYLGRISGISESNGNNITYSYDLNSQVISINSNRDGLTLLNYDGAGRIQQKTSPVKSTIDYSYNIRGDKLSDEKGEYYYDLLSRLTGISYINGDSDFWTYDADGKKSSFNGGLFEYDKLGNLTRWQNENADVGIFEYNGLTASRVLGLPDSLTGTGNITSYAFSWNSNGRLDSLIPVGKVGSYQHGWSSTKELSSVNFPNAVYMTQTWTNKILDSIHIQYNDSDYLLTDSEYDTYDRFVGLTQSVLADDQNYFSETNNLVYNMQNKLSELGYQSLNRLLQIQYQQENGLPNTIDFSDIGEYTVSYNSLTNNINSVVYPQQAGTESFFYNGGLGRLSKISYPNNRNLNMIWNDKNQISRISYNNQGLLTNYIFTYTFSGDLAGYTMSEGGIQIENWIFSYGPFGLEKAIQTTSPTITEDFITDPSGRILAMIYSKEGGAENVEYYFHYDNFGNTTLLTDSLGIPQYSALYDIWTGKTLNEWNPNDLMILNKGFGINGDITIELPEMIEVTLSEAIYIRNRYATVNVTDISVRINQDISPMRTKEECREICYKTMGLDPQLMKRCLLACEEGRF